MAQSDVKLTSSNQAVAMISEFDIINSGADHKYIIRISKINFLEKRVSNRLVYSGIREFYSMPSIFITGETFLFAFPCKKV